MSAKMNSVEARFLGQRMVLKSHEDEKFIQEVIQFATDRLTEAEKRVKGAAPHQTALLALLDLSEEYIKAKRRALDHKREVTEKAEELNRLIEAELK